MNFTFKYLLFIFSILLYFNFLIDFNVFISQILFKNKKDSQKESGVKPIPYIIYILIFKYIKEFYSINSISRESFVLYKKNAG